MEKKHRDNILQNSAALKELIDFEKLKVKLRESKIFPGDMLLDIEDAGPAKNEKLLQFIPKRGPSAYPKFVKCLIDSGQLQAARVLEDIIPDAGVWHGDVIRSTDWPRTNGKVYKMSSRPRGVALIISNTSFDEDGNSKRYGGEVDEKNLQRLFQLLGFVVDLHINKSRGVFLYCDILEEGLHLRAEIWQILSNFQHDERHGSADAAIIVIMSHGSNGGFFTADNIILSNEDILKMFNNANCSALHDKPKIFFFAHCRGDEPDYAIPRKVMPDSIPTRPETLPTFSDMRICYSTCPSFYSIRCEVLGTWFISTLVETFSQNAHNTDLDTMLRNISYKMAQMDTISGWKQTPEYTERGWKYPLYFNPGL